ncbi:CBS domain-containing protein [Leptolyngbya sp. CCNP1308]|uniref:CBS domain-containing protein n=1 Tax=Leptolyngbya sp. CCNP1308 TaxID=3110255 RepID=UPI002B208A9F|nr:CBS domain-containing protein [Leptolyngbya sp. CCNP1308]MEA5448083.1 CBS domain-containing protein [Leptolyngbya sp. CCNP1308]
MATAKDIMTDDVATIKGSATVAEAVQLMKFKQLHSLIVERRGPEDAYGIVTTRDIVNQVVAYGKDPKTVKIYEIMTKPCLVVNPDLGIEYVARLFARFGIDRAPVIQNELLGIISDTDILLKGDFVENPRVPLLQKALQAEVAHARGVSAAKGPYSAAGKAAWESVAELEAELAFCQGQVPDQSAVEPAPQVESALV